ncbi:MAG: hypothetical protein H6711_16325 [Myxococcales bacterium]|nr:hypothetical protein [Myxococcales bacterium]
MARATATLALLAALVGGCFSDPGAATSASGASATGADASGSSNDASSSGDAGSGGTESGSAGSTATTTSSATTSTSDATATATATTTTTTTDSTTTDSIPTSGPVTTDPTTTGGDPDATASCGTYCDMEEKCSGANFDACLADCLAYIDQGGDACKSRWGSYASCVGQISCREYLGGNACVPEVNALVIVCEHCDIEIDDNQLCGVTYHCGDDLQILCDGDYCQCAYNDSFFDECTLDVPDLCAVDEGPLLDAAAECCPWLAG